jgi:hypothetical protein
MKQPMNRYGGFDLCGEWFAQLLILTLSPKGIDCHFFMHAFMIEDICYAFVATPKQWE